MLFNFGTVDNHLIPRSDRAAISSSSQPVFAELRDPDKLTAILGAWSDLSSNLEQDNPFYHHWAMRPALAAFGHKGVKIACVWDGEGRDQLIFLAPIVAQPFYAKLPIGHWATWIYPHCYFGAPLVRRGRGEDAAAGLIDMLCGDGSAKSFLQFRRIDINGAVANGFRKFAARNGSFTHEAGSYERAILEARSCTNDFVATNFRKKQQKELRRQRRRLADLGPVQFQQLSDFSKLDVWLDEFFQLEHGGWKAASGTSLYSTAKDARWFRQLVHGAAAEKRLLFFRLSCAQKPVAMLIIVGSGECFSLKICHDPAFSRYSPGVLVEIESTKALLEQPGFQSADSCAAPNHPMINRIWRGRRTIGDLNISSAHPSCVMKLKLCQTLQRLRKRMPQGGGK